MKTLSRLIKEFEIFQSNNINFIINTSMASFYITVTLFFVFYFLMWKKTVSDIKLTFKTALEKSTQIIKNKTSKSTAIDVELEEFVSIIESVAKKLLLSDQELKKKSEQLNSVREKERALIAQHLHDNLGQNITALKLEIAIIKKLVSNPESIYRMQTILDDSIHIITALTQNLRIPKLSSQGLIVTLDDLIQDRNKLDLIKISFRKHQLPSQFSSEHAIAIFRCVQESITNIFRHSKASHAPYNFQIKKRLL